MGASWLGACRLGAERTPPRSRERGSPLPAGLTVALAVLGALVMATLGWRFSRERARPVWTLVVPPALTFLVVAPVIYRSATESAGDAPLMVGGVVGAVVGVEFHVGDIRRGRLPFGPIAPRQGLQTLVETCNEIVNFHLGIVP